MQTRRGERQLLVPFWRNDVCYNRLVRACAFLIAWTALCFRWPGPTCLKERKEDRWCSLVCLQSSPPSWHLCTFRVEKSKLASDLQWMCRRLYSLLTAAGGIAPAGIHPLHLSTRGTVVHDVTITYASIWLTTPLHRAIYLWETLSGGALACRGNSL